MSTNERPIDEVPTSPSTPSSSVAAGTSDAPSSPAPNSAAPSSGRASGAPSSDGRASGAPGGGKKKKKRKKKPNGESVTTAPPAAVATASSSAVAASSEDVSPPAADKDVSQPRAAKSVPPPSAANTNGSAVAASPALAHEDIAEAPHAAADLDHHFFESHAAHDHDSLHPIAHVDDVKAPDPRLAALMREETLRRRAQFTKYVKVILAGSMVVCVAAIISVSMRRTHPDATVAAAATTPMRPMRLAPPPPASVSVEPSAASANTDPSVASATAEPSTSATPPTDAPMGSASAAATDSAPVPSPGPEPSASAAAPPSSASGEPTAELDPKAALKEKRQSQRALDNGKVADAIEHGEASVKLDPTDAEAWLILGAAYQMKGDLANAKRSFGSCLKEGKRGPRGECAAMPH
jgi:hypothetical protein